MNNDRTEFITMTIGSADENINLGFDDEFHVTDYNDLTGKPQINSVVLSGNKTTEELGIEEDKFYIHRQDVASSEWNIEHNLNKFPSVSIVDSSENEIFGDIEYISSNNLKVKFIGAFTGKAYLN